MLRLAPKILSLLCPVFARILDHEGGEGKCSRGLEDAMNSQRLATRRDRGSRVTNKLSRMEPSANQRRLTVEGLEPRLLLYSVSGGVWPHPELVTVSFMPDGTDAGGIPTNLFSTM